jgi:uncharacterized protein YkwD
MIMLINQARCSNGLTPVTPNNNLDTAATNHSIDMAVNNFFSHTGSDGSTPLTRAVAAGYSAIQIGEVISAGQTSVNQAFNALMANDSATILDPELREMGLGHVSSDSSDFGHYWTLMMGTRGTTPPTCADVGL